MLSSLKELSDYLIKFDSQSSLHYSVPELDHNPIMLWLVSLTAEQ